MDPRVQRTRHQLQNALLELARGTDLDEITVAEIVAHAGVNRSSFYQHYRDKESLLADALEQPVTEVTDSLIAQRLVAPTPLPEELVSYLAHIAANADVYRRALGTHGSSLVAQRITHRIEDAVRRASDLIVAGTERGVPSDLVAGALAGAIMAVIVGWLRHDPLPDVAQAVGWIESTLSHPLISWLTPPETEAAPVS